MDIKIEIGNRIKRVRGKLSQQAFSKQLNVGQTTVGRYERGERSPDAEFLLLLKNHFNISPNWLISGDGQMHDGETQCQSSKEKKTEIEFDQIPLHVLKQIVSDHNDLMDEFIDKKTGKEFNSILLELERRSAKEYYSLLGYAKRVLAELESLDEPDYTPDEPSTPGHKKETVKKIY